MKTGIAAYIDSSNTSRTVELVSLLILMIAFLLPGVCLAGPADGLLGHWKLAGDCPDYSSRRNHGINHGADLTDPHAATFDGVDDYIEVPAAESLVLGRKDSSFAVWIHTAAELDDVLGDILSKYDPVTQTGITFSIMNYAAVSSGQSNYRNLSFGIDAGRVDPQWTDCGRPGNNQLIWALTVYDGHLYASTWEPSAAEAGHVYRYEGGARWTDCGAPDRCNSIETMAVYRGKLYAGSSSHTGGGSALPKSPNRTPGGTVYRYEGGTQWTDCGKIDGLPRNSGLARVSGLTVFGDQLYATTNSHEEKGLYRYEGEDRWSDCGHPGRRVVRVSPYNGNLYATTNDGGQVARFDSPHNWTDLGTIPKTTQLYSYAVHRGRQYCATWPLGLVFRHEGEGVFKDCGQLGNEKEVMPMTVYNGHFPWRRFTAMTVRTLGASPVGWTTRPR